MDGISHSKMTDFHLQHRKLYLWEILILIALTLVSKM